jgi:hypothetical protein
MARLVAESGPLQGRTFPIDVGITLGREAHNTIPMPENRHASREHCKVWREAAGRYAIADFGSTNGTVVNEGRITRATLADGDRIRIGDVVLRFELEDADRPKPKTEAPARPDLAAVLRGDARPAAPARGTGAAEGDRVEIKERILQYQRKSRRGTLLGWDLGQTAGWRRWALIVLALGAAVGAFLLARNLAVGARKAAEVPAVEQPADAPP